MGASRIIAVGLSAAGLLAAALLVLVRPLGAPAIAQQNSPTYVGVATCGGTTCHGRSEADGAVVRQDELMIWQDPSSPAGAHSRAYAVLREPRSLAIAQRLGISLNTCRGYVKTMLRKLGAHSQLEAVAIASRQGLFDGRDAV